MRRVCILSQFTLKHIHIVITGESSVRTNCPLSEGQLSNAIVKRLFNEMGAPLREWCLAFVRPDCTDPPRNGESTYKGESLHVHGFWMYQKTCGGLKGVQDCCRLWCRFRLRPGRGHGSLQLQLPPRGELRPFLNAGVDEP